MCYAHGMDKFSVITQALRRLGDREYEQDSAVYDPVNIFFDSVMRECNARHHWSFARRTRVKLEPWHEITDRGEERFCRHHHHHHQHDDEDLPENAPEGTKKGRLGRGRHKLPRKHTSTPSRACQGAFYVPSDCLRIMEVVDECGRKLRHWSLSMDVDRQERILIAPGEGAAYLTYTADLIQCGSAIPDFAPMYCNGVIALLAARLAPSMLGNEQLGQMLFQEAEGYLREAILQDKRQERSNDQHPLRGILERDITAVMRYPSQIYYL